MIYNLIIKDGEEEKKIVLENASRDSLRELLISHKINPAYASLLFTLINAEEEAEIENKTSKHYKIILKKEE